MMRCAIDLPCSWCGAVIVAGEEFKLLRHKKLKVSHPFHRVCAKRCLEVGRKYDEIQGDEQKLL